MAKASEKYEVMYIINPNFSEEETAAVVEKFKALVEANGTLDEIEEIGGAVLSGELGAISAEHLIATGEKGMASMAKGGVLTAIKNFFGT